MHYYWVMIVIIPFIFVPEINWQKVNQSNTNKTFQFQPEISESNSMNEIHSFLSYPSKQWVTNGRRKKTHSVNQLKFDFWKFMNYVQQSTKQWIGIQIIIIQVWFIGNWKNLAKDGVESVVGQFD